MDPSRTRPSSALVLEGPQLPNIPGNNDMYRLALGPLQPSYRPAIAQSFYFIRHGGDEEFVGLSKDGWFWQIEQLW